MALTILTIMPALGAYNMLPWNPNFVIFYYDSYDANKNKVRLSGKAYYRLAVGDTWNTPKKHILLACHPTVTDNYTTPTGEKPVDGDVSRMVTEDNNSTIVISPDYCGYGVSSHLQHPYLIHDVTARNCYDALLPAIEALKAVGVTFTNSPDGSGNDRYELRIIGYSQGGATALACAKYYDSDACPEKITKYFNLRETCCGDGPYSIYETLNQYLEWGDPKRADGGKDLEYACVIPLILSAAKTAYDDGCMRTVEVEDYLSPEFIATGIIEYIKTKNVSTPVLGKKISQSMKRLRPVDVMSRKIINEDGTFNTSTKEYKCFMRVMELADLCSGWEPKHDIYFYHIESDGVVPYVNYSKGIMGENGIGRKYPEKVHYVDYKDAWSSTDTYLALISNTVLPDWDTMKHDRGGVYFYMSYLFGYDLHSKLK